LIADEWHRGNVFVASARFRGRLRVRHRGYMQPGESAALDSDGRLFYPGTRDFW